MPIMNAEGLTPWGVEPTLLAERVTTDVSWLRGYLWFPIAGALGEGNRSHVNPSDYGTEISCDQTRRYEYGRNWGQLATSQEVFVFPWQGVIGMDSAPGDERREKLPNPDDQTDTIGGYVLENHRTATVDMNEVTGAFGLTLDITADEPALRLYELMQSSELPRAVRFAISRMNRPMPKPRGRRLSSDRP